MLSLEGVRVVEFTNILSGPFCGMLLADMGADVIKVEKPTGDDMRFLATDYRGLQRELCIREPQ